MHWLRSGYCQSEQIVEDRVGSRVLYFPQSDNRDRLEAIHPWHVDAMKCGIGIVSRVTIMYGGPVMTFL